MQGMAAAIRAAVPGDDFISTTCAVRKRGAESSGDRQQVVLRDQNTGDGIGSVSLRQ